VCLADRDPERAADTLARIQALGGEAFVCAGDVTSAADGERMVAQTVQRYGRVDTLVNNVGIASAPGRFDTFDEAAWSRVLDVNLRSAVLMCRAAVPRMVAQGSGGAIVNISSIAGLRAFGNFDYGPSKAALNQFTTEVALAYGRHGIRANTVAPGHILTPLSQGLLPAEARAMRRKVGPLGVEGDAWDVAAATLFLASDEARFVTGVLLPVDGGVSTLGALAGHALIQEAD
jgi:NAD(P)-dependent dehydrogenase (short-subunit alcohol dehydrogenase family)